MATKQLPDLIFPIYNSKRNSQKTVNFDINDYVNKNDLSVQILSGQISVPSLTTQSIQFNGTTQSIGFTDDDKNNLDGLLSDTRTNEHEMKLTDISYDESLLKTTIDNNCYIDNLKCGNLNVDNLSNTTGNLQTQINALRTATTAMTYNTTTQTTSISDNLTATNFTTTNFTTSNLFLTGEISARLLTTQSIQFNGTTQSIAFTEDDKNNLDDLMTDERTNINNMKLTDISYNEPLLKTTINNNCYIDNLTCGNLNVSDLSNTSGNLQNQINNINSPVITDLIDKVNFLYQVAYPALNPYSSGVKAVSTWTLRTAATNTWSSICWSSELMLFVAVSYDTTGNIIITSSDGITWTSRTSAANSNWKSVCWARELSLFVAVSSTDGTNSVMTSSNGINWTLRACESNSWTSACWSSELKIFVAVAQDTTRIGFRAMYSSNGINWVLSSTNDNNWRSVCWSPQLSLFVAVSSNGTNRVMTSSNGINWTSRLVVANSWEAVCWSPELRKFCAVSSSGTNRVMTSSDGINWNTYAASNAYSWLSVCWSPQLMLFVATALTGGTTDKIMSSPDGMKWTSRTSPNIAFESICWSPELGIFCGVSSTGTSGYRVITSSLDGRPPTSQNVFNSSSNNIDNSGNWDIKARNLNLQNGLIQGRSDGLNYANNIYDIYVGYCLYIDSTAVSFQTGGATYTLAASRTLPPGVYMISGIVVLAKGNIVNTSSAAFNTSWTSSGGTVPGVVNRQLIPTDQVNPRIDLPTTYLIITNTAGGTVSPRYQFIILTGGSTAEVSYEVSIIRIA